MIGCENLREVSHNSGYAEHQTHNALLTHESQHGSVCVRQC